MFLKKCPVYDVHPGRYFKPYMPLHHYHGIAEGVGFVKRNSSADKDRLERYRSFAEEMAQGTHSSKKRCWQCEQLCPNGLQTCSKCRAAGYCSRDCPALAWKGGHKHKCEDLNIFDQSYQNSLFYKEEFECSPCTAALLEKAWSVGSKNT